MSGTKRWAAGLFIALIFMYNHVGALAQGETSAKAACVLEMETGRVLFEQNARARLPMASTTKVMTALLAIENGDLSSAVITFVVEAIGSRARALYSNNTRPVSISITQAAFALVSPCAKPPP